MVVILGEVLDLPLWLTFVVIVIYSFVADRYWLRPHRKGQNEWADRPRA
jgi:hypothetical protein